MLDRLDFIASTINSQKPMQYKITRCLILKNYIDCSIADMEEITRTICEPCIRKKIIEM